MSARPAAAACCHGPDSHHRDIVSDPALVLSPQIGLSTSFFLLICLGASFGSRHIGRAIAPVGGRGHRSGAGWCVSTGAAHELTVRRLLTSLSLLRERRR